MGEDDVLASPPRVQAANQVLRGSTSVRLSWAAASCWAIREGAFCREQVHVRCSAASCRGGGSTTALKYIHTKSSSLYTLTSYRGGNGDWCFVLVFETLLASSFFRRHEPGLSLYIYTASDDCCPSFSHPPLESSRRVCVKLNSSGRERVSRSQARRRHARGRVRPD